MFHNKQLFFGYSPSCALCIFPFKKDFVFIKINNDFKWNTDQDKLVLLRNKSHFSSILRQLGLILFLAAWEKALKHKPHQTCVNYSQFVAKYWLVSVGQVLSPCVSKMPQISLPSWTLSLSAEITQWKSPSDWLVCC